MSTKLSPVISGMLRTSNGSTPDVSWKSTGELQTERWKLAYHLNVARGEIIVEYCGDLEIRSEQYDEIDELFRITRNLIESVVFTKVGTEGMGLQYSLQSCRTTDGELIIAKPDQAPSINLPALNENRIFELLARDPQLRFAIRDFNAGLLDRENCPFLFYRATETLAKVVTKKEVLEDTDWKDYHSKIGTNRSDMKLLEEIAGKHRHGTHSYFSKPQHLEMMQSARYFLVLTLQYLMKS